MKLEDRLPDALARIADSTPVNDRGAFDPNAVTIRSDLPSPASSRRRVTVAAALVVLGVAGLMVVVNRPGTNGTSDAPTPPASSSVSNTTGMSDPSGGGEPGPPGSMVLPDSTGMSVVLAQQGLLAGDSSVRWYATGGAQPETETYLRLFSLRKPVPSGDRPGCLLAASATRSTSLDDGTPVCLEVRDASRQFGRIALERTAYSVVIEGNASDDELLAAASHVVPSTTDDGFEITAAGLPQGVAETGRGWTVSDFAATSVDAATRSMIRINWADASDRSIFYVATADEETFMSNLRLGYQSVTDATVRGVPAFIQTLERQPTYLGVVWHENGTTFQVGGQRLSEPELLHLVEQMRPATQSEWLGSIAARSAPAATTDEVAATTIAFPVLTTPPPSAGCLYTVVEGDNPTVVAGRFAITVDELSAANERNPIYQNFLIGHQLNIPNYGTQGNPCPQFGRAGT